jgi:cytochrome c biogenesis protein CcmG/thiol:disulfide interchange protein DsbE
MRPADWAALCVCAILGGCSQTLPPPSVGAPPFSMPAAGTATDTVLRIGDPFPEIETIDLDGKPVVLGSRVAGGGYTLVVFWSTWCGFCMLELPHEVELAEHYAPHGLRVIGINGDETPGIAKAAVEEYGVPWLNVYEGRDLPISRRLDVNQWPVLLLLDPDGRVLCATQQLRGLAVESLPDGSTRAVSGLDWTLEHVLGANGPMP